MALDAMAAAPRCFWAVALDPDVEGVIEIVRSPRELSVYSGGWGWQWWRYELPALTLRERRPIKLGIETTPKQQVLVYGSWAAPDGTVYVLTCTLPDASMALLVRGTSHVEARLPLHVPAESFAAAGVATDELFAFAFVSGPDAEVRLFDRALRLRAHFHLPATNLPRLRFCGADLVIAADAGRLTIFDTDRGSLRTVAVG